MLKVRLNLRRVVAIATCFAVTTMFSGCDDDEKQPEITVENQASLTQTVYAEQIAGNSVVTFTTAGAWTSAITEGIAKSTGSETVIWLSISPGSGNAAGTYTVIISLEPNATGVDRSAIITILCNGTNIVITVTQKATKENGTLYGQDITFEDAEALNQTVYADEYPTTILFVTKGAWTSSKTATWMSINPSQGSAAGSYSVTVSLEPNATGSDRSGSITISCAETNKTVNITQKAINRDGTPYDPDAPRKGDVYVAGNISNRAVFWKNGVAQYLTDGTNDAWANSVFVSGKDVYVAGYEKNAQTSGDAKLWKNGVAQNLTDGTYHAEPYSVFVSGNNVHVGGYEYFDKYIDGYFFSNWGYSATLWTNGTAQKLSNEVTSVIYSVFVSGSDVYAVGYDRNDEEYNQEVAILWKNGIRQALSPVEDECSYAQSVFVSGSDVYVAFRQHASNPRIYVASLWKNGVIQTLTDGTRYSMANSVFVSGSDAYVAGWEDNVQGIEVATLWKNHTTQKLTDGTRNANAESVYVSENVVYVAGWENNAQGFAFATLWENGVKKNLTNGTVWSSAQSVFVVE